MEFNMSTVARPITNTTGDVTLNGVQIVAGIWLKGGTAATVVYNNTSAVAADKVIEIISTATGVYTEFSTPLRLSHLFLDTGAGITDSVIYVV